MKIEQAQDVARGGCGVLLLIRVWPLIRGIQAVSALQGLVNELLPVHLPYPITSPKEGGGAGEKVCACVSFDADTCCRPCVLVRRSRSCLWM